jgi:HAE1 family hydrophobic/amphiphilic exporter-1
MKLADVSIKRPVFATMMILSLLVLGLFSFIKLNVDLYPDVDFPFVIVTTTLPGAGAQQIETDITKVIENSVNSIEGIDHISSISQDNLSIVTIQFKLSVNGKDAALDVIEKISAIRSQLPADVKDPIVQRYDPASMPIMTLAISGNLSAKDLTTFTKDVIQKRVENIQGVGSADLVGGAEREIQIEVDANKLRAYNLSIQEVINSVGSQNVEIPGGNLTEGSRQLLVNTKGKFKTVNDFNKVIVASPMGKPIFLSEVANVIDGTKEQTSLTQLNGKNAIGLNIIKQSGANTVNVAKAVKDQIAKLKTEVPAGTDIVIAQDQSTFIEEAINSVFFDILYGGLLAVIVIYLFLANLRSTIISALALPTSIIASFILMYALNFTLNMMSLLALSLAVGLLIDDAIVVIENIYRHMSQGETALEAAKSATEEIGLAVMATTFTIVAVFVPVAFMPGLVGKFFYQFGMTITSAVLVSLFVAFTLTPMLSSRWLKREDEKLSPKGNPVNKSLYYFNHFFEKLNGNYHSALRWSLNHRKTVIFSSIIIFVLSLFIMGSLGFEFFPQSGQGEFNITVKVAPGSSLNETNNICKKIETVVKKRPEVKDLLVTIGAGNDPVTKATILVKLVPKSERNINEFVLMEEIRNEIKYIPGAEYSLQEPGGPGGNQKPVSLSVRGPDLNVLQNIAAKVENIVKQTPGAVDVGNSYEVSKPEVNIEIDRNKASDLGVNPYIVASTVRSFIDGTVATQFEGKEEQIDVRVKLKKDERKNINDLALMTVMSNKKISGQNFLIPITEIAAIKQSVSPTQINRYDKQKEILVSANTYGRTLGVILQDITNKTSAIKLDPGYSISVTGTGQMQSESFGDILISLMLAIVFVYIVLAAQFDNFVHPLSIMLALPMAIIGAVLMLLIFGSSISIMSLIGIIMLMGLVTKNGILLIDYTNVLRERGIPRFEALLQAGPTRLRPILMTTFAMIFGMIPVAIGAGEGSEFRAPMGQAVIGGLITSTFLTLFIVPVVYSILDDLNSSSFTKFTKKLFSKKKK